MRGLRRRVGMVAMSCGMVGVLLPGSSASAQNSSPAGANPASLVPLSSDAAAPLSHSGAAVLSPAASSTPVHIALAFRPSHPAELASFAAAVSNPHSPTYRHFLSVAQFRSHFGPSATTIAGTDSYLRSFGLKVAGLAPNGLFQSVSGSAAKVSSALSVPMERVRTKTGAVVTGAIQAPHLPSALAGGVASIAGLHPWASPAPAGLQKVTPKAASSQLASPATSTSPVSTCSAMAADYYATPSNLASYYKLNAFYAKGVTGSSPIGLVEFASFSPSDISTWESCLGIKTPVTTVTAGSVPSSGASLEPTADIQQLLGLAPSSPVTVYQGTSPIQVWQAAISADSTRVISSSWGICEQATTSSQISAEATLFQEAAAQGQTVVQASGDWGAQACYPNSNTSYQNALSVWDPASQPYVTSVGGIYVNSSGGATVWNSQQVSGSSGGGLSTLQSEPTYQVGSANPGLLTYASSCTNAGGCRQVPDVSAIAGNGMDAYCTFGGCATSGAGWTGVAGTSMSAPQWAAALALESQVCGSELGFVNPTLYQQSSPAPSGYLSPVTTGSNAFSSSQGYSANSSGYYSPTTGLGSLGGNGASTSLAAGQLCSSASGQGGTTASPSDPPKMTLSPSSVSFGTVVANTSPVSATVKVSNTGSAPLGTAVAKLSVSNISTSGTGFSVASNTCGSPVPEGQSCSVELSFSSKTAGQASGTLTISSNASNSPQSIPLSADVKPPVSGYYLVTGQGNTFNYGVGWSGSPASFSHSPVVGIATAGSTNSYWEATAAGNVYNFGGAKWYGSAAGSQISGHVVAIVATADKKGYWLVSSGGNVYNFGDASWYGSVANMGLASPVAGMVAAPSGGYYLFSSAGNVYNFGGATWYGSAAGKQLPSPITAMAPMPSGGYWLAEANGTVLGFGSAGVMSPAAMSPNPVVAMVAMADGRGYWLVSNHGNVYNFGDASWYGSAASLQLPSPVVGIGISS